MNHISTPAPGAVIAGRTLVRIVGEGAMGVVFETRTPEGETTALKLLKPEKAANERTVEEFRCDSHDSLRCEPSSIHQHVVVGRFREGRLPAPE